MEGKKFPILLVLVIVLLIVFVFTAVIVGFIVVGGGNSNSNSAKSAAVAIPKDSELAIVELFDEDTSFNLKNDNTSNPLYVPLITVKAEIKYHLKLKNSSIKDTKVKIDAYLGEIQELLSLYLKELTPEKARDMQKTAGEDLKKQINKLLNENEEKHGDVVYTFTFTKWLIT